MLFAPSERDVYDTGYRFVCEDPLKSEIVLVHSCGLSLKSRRSRRMRIAHRFIGGIGDAAREVVREADG